MNLRKLFFRDTQLESVDVLVCWEVRWESRHGEWSHNVKPEIRAFPTEDGARAFANALNAAFKLIKHTSGTKVTVTKQTFDNPGE
jgi:hypothetical protein